VIEAKWHEDFETQAVQIVLMSEDGGERYVGKPVMEGCGIEWAFARAPRGSILPQGAVLALPREIARAIWGALAQWAEGEGLRREPHERVLGKLDATERHLGDMRALVAKGFRVDLEDREGGK